MKYNNHNLLIIAMLIVAIGLITFCLPNKSYQGYVYTQGKPWGYAMLTAPFDIPIEYDSATAHRITDSINANFIKIYRNDFSVVNKQLNSLNAALLRHGVSAETRQGIMAQVSMIYDAGIVDNDSYDMIAQEKMPEIRILTNKIADVVSTEGMHSVKSAYALLDSTLNTVAYHNALVAASVYNYLTPNLTYDSVETKQLLNDAYQKALAPQGIVQTGESIIFPGNVVTPEKYSILQAYERMMRERQAQSTNINYGILGQLAFVSIMMLVFYFYMKHLRPRTFVNRRKMVFLISFLALFVVTVEIVIAFRPNYIYLIPFALLPIIITTFTDTRTSSFLHMIAVLLCSMVVKNQAEFIIMQFLAGNIAIASIKQLSRRSQLAHCAFFIFMSYSVSYVALYVMREGSMHNIFTGGSWHIFVMFFINCAVLSFAYLLIFLIEKIFGFTSTVTLVELSDINSPELRALSNSCPGTFQHSLQVANLAAEAAHNINANVQLARAGALYHDIGKINNPAFFTENQVGVNPHDGLTPQQSAHIVISHVTDGLKRAEKARLPQVISDFITQHHGKSLAKYFYTMECKAHDGDAVDPTPFTYPGPNPQSKEAAIVMMADACEAAAKSLSNPDEKQISAIVNKIIDSQIVNGLLNEAPISFSDVGIIKHTFIEQLRSFYHMRISYPDDVKPVPRKDSDEDDENQMPD